MLRGIPLKSLEQKAQKEARKQIESQRYSEFLALSSKILAFLSYHTTHINAMHAFCHKTIPLLEECIWFILDFKVLDGCKILAARLRNSRRMHLVQVKKTLFEHAFLGIEILCKCKTRIMCNYLTTFIMTFFEKLSDQQQTHSFKVFQSFMLCLVWKIFFNFYFLKTILISIFFPLKIEKSKNYFRKWNS